LRTLFFILTLPPLHSPLFPYTTLFRSRWPAVDAGRRGRRAVHAARLDECPPTDRRVLERDGQADPMASVRTMLNSAFAPAARLRSEEHTSELQSLTNLVCRLLLEKKNT